MKAYLHELCAAAATPLLAQHRVREYLQARIMSDNWWAMVRQRVAELDWQENVVRDLRAFLIEPEILERVQKDELLSLLKR